MATRAPIKVLNASVILFPGQGSQYVGMVKKNLCARGKSLFEMANQVLGYDLLSMCQHGPEAELNKTVHSQPAVFVSSLAAVERLADMSLGAVESCYKTAGFSVGEFAALVFAQSIDFVEALKLIKLRAETTQEVCNNVPSGMLTLIGGRAARFSELCHLAKEYCVRSGVSVDESVCSIATHIFPHAKVIGGHQKALEFIELHGKDFGIIRTKRLSVSGAFHTQLMRPAREDLRKALNKTKLHPPKIQVYSNIDAKIYQDVDQIKRSIIRHLCMPVKWEQTIQNMYGKIGVDEKMPITFECGPQDNMTTILGMNNLRAKKLAYSIEPCSDDN